MNKQDETNSKILILGDSNGASEHGWVNQLEHLCQTDSFHNTSVSGNTIGFDNLNNAGLNTLKNINRYLDEADAQLNGIDKIIIMLGTNDCKAVFHDSLNVVPTNLGKLISKIKSHSVYTSRQPEIFIVSPPPYGKDDIMKEKYHGGAERVAWLYPQFRKIAVENDCFFIDIYTPLLPKWSEYAKEGIHPNAAGQMVIAETIYQALNKN